jgi:hypothetical protein
MVKEHKSTRDFRVYNKHLSCINVELLIEGKICIYNDNGNIYESILYCDSLKIYAYIDLSIYQKVLLNFLEKMYISASYRTECNMIIIRYKTKSTDMNNIKLLSPIMYVYDKYTYDTIFIFSTNIYMKDKYIYLLNIS